MIILNRIESHNGETAQTDNKFLSGNKGMPLVHEKSCTLLQCTVVLKCGRQRFKTIVSNL